MENSYRIAYLISAYKDPLHLKRLCEVLSYNMSKVHFFIHIDKKVDITPFVNLVKGSNIHYVANRYWSNWGGQIKFCTKRKCCGAHWHSKLENLRYQLNVKSPNKIAAIY